MILDYNDHPYIPFFIVSICLLVASFILIATINENKILKLVEADLIKGEELSQSLEKVEEDKPLSKGDKKNLIILLVSTFIWYMAFNALESFLSLYCKNILGDEKVSGTVTIILTISSVITFIPAGILSNKIGRKLSVLIGIICLFVGFLGSAIVSPLGDIRKYMDFKEEYVSETYTLDNSTLELSLDGTYVLNLKNKETKGKYTKYNEYVELDSNIVYTLYSNGTYKASIDKTLESYKNVSSNIAPYLIGFYFFVVFAGIGWAMINVSSYPMVCELASQSNIGRISGLYYLASMLAQSVTPVLIGAIMAFGTGYQGLFYYSSILTVLAFVCFMLYKENKQKVEIVKKGFFEGLDVDN